MKLFLFGLILLQIINRLNIKFFEQHFVAAKKLRKKVFINSRKIKLSFVVFLIFSALVEGKIDVYFSMLFDDKNQPRPAFISKKIIEKIQKAQEHIFMAIYTFTSNQIANALILQKEKYPNLKIEIIVDRFSMFPAGKAKLLAKNGINVFLFEEKVFFQKLKLANSSEPKIQRNFGFQSSYDPVMHNKFAVIDDLLITGSYNFSLKADTKNLENILFIQAETANEKDVLRQYLSNFEDLKKYTTILSESNFARIVHNKKHNRQKKDKKIHLTSLNLGKKLFLKIKQVFDYLFV